MSMVKGRKAKIKEQRREEAKEEEQKLAALGSGKVVADELALDDRTAVPHRFGRCPLSAPEVPALSPCVGSRLAAWKRGGEGLILGAI